MSSTDDRIVQMKFDNEQFKKGAADTQKSLADLDKATAAAGKSKGLLDLNSQMGQVAIAASKMQIVTTTALATIANHVVNAGINMAKALTISPIAQGFSEYESLLTKQNTIMNATGLGAQKVKGYLNELNTFSDQTIYSFGNMTESITKFVNAGISLPRSVESIKGIANAAAYAGASTQDANRAMFAFSQSMSTGFIMLNDWMQIENANMATQQFKQTLIDSGVEAGTLTKRGKEYITASGKAITSTKGWRDGLQEQWATTEVLNRALGKYNDQSTKLGRKAAESAKEVRTFTAFMDTLKESIGSGWASIFTSLFGNLKQATTFWTGFSEAIGGSVQNFFSFISASLKAWRQMGGFEKVLGGLKNILAPFGAILSTIGAAWKEAFPNSGAGSGKVLYGLSAAFEAVTRPLQWLADLIRGTTPILTTIFRVFRIGGEIIGTIAGKIGAFVGDLIGLADLKPPSSGGFIGFIKDLAGAISDAVEKIDDLLQKGASLSQAFGSVSFDLPSMPSMPDMPSMPSLPDVGSMFASGDGGKLAAMSTGVKNLTGDVKDLGGASEEAASKGLFDGGDVMNVLSTIGGFFVKIKDGIADFISGFNADDLVSAFNTAIFATMGYEIIRFVHSLRKNFEAFMGIGESFNQLIGGAGDALKSFQTQAKAKLILNIAIALLLLAGALWILSKIPADKLAIALGALAASMLIMNAGMKTITKLVEVMNKDGLKTSVNMLALSVAVVALAVGMVLMATALLLFNKVEWQSIFKGLITLAAVMIVLKTLGQLSEGAAKNMVGAAAAIAIIGGAMILLAAALILFQFVKWESMAKAGVVLAALTIAIGLLAMIPYGGIEKVGVAMLAVSIAMLALANALILFGLVSWESIGKAAVVLGLLTLALIALMAVGGPVAVSGIVGLGVGMVFLAGALMVLNSVEWASIGKLALVLGILIVAFAAFTAVMYLAAPIVPLIVLLGVAMVLLGLGLLAFAGAMAIAVGLAGAGIAAFAALGVGAAVAIAVFMQTLAREAPIMKQAFLDILQALIDTIVEAVPMVIQGIKDLWAAVKAEFTSSDKKKATGDAGKSWIEKLGEGISKKLPAIVKMAAELMVKFLNALRSKASALAEAGIGVIVAVINGISKKVGDITAAAVNLIIKFAQGIKDGAVKILAAGVALIASFLHDLANIIRGGSAAIGSGIDDVVSAMKEVGMDMVRGLIAGVGEMFDEAMGAIGDLAGGMVNKAKGILDIFSPSRVFRDIGKFLVAGLTQGIQQNAASAIVAVASMVSGQIALSEDLINGFIQRLDQKSIAARARAEGLARAAKKAQAAANKTKVNTDDRAANKISRSAKKADKAAQKAEKAAAAERNKQAAARKWENSSEIERAQIKAGQAQSQINAAKAAEREAQANRIEAAALMKQSRAAGVTEKQRKAMRKEAERLRKEAREEAIRANSLLASAAVSAADAMKWQKLAGEEAAKAYQDQYDAEKKADADAEAFEKLSAADKAKQRRKEADDMQKLADANLAKAKEKAFTDLAAANALAELALTQAETARDLLDQAIGFEGESGGNGQVVNLDPTDAAAAAFNQYADLYDSAMAAAAAAPTVEFTQINQSPEALDPTTIYRQTNNLLTFAADKVAS